MKNVETRFDTSNYELDRPLPKEKSKIIIRLMKDELRGEIMTEFGALIPKTYSYFTDENDENKKAKDTRKVSYKENLNLRIINIV